MADEHERQVKIDLYEDLIGGAVREVRQTFRVALPVRVKSAYRSTSRADVTFGVRWLATNRQVFDEPPAPALPVLLPRGGGYGVHFDLREGDLGVALSCDGPVSGLYDTGEPVTPQFPQGHDYGCAVLYPGGRVSNGEVPTEPPNPTGTMTVGAEDGTATVELRGRGLPSLAAQGTLGGRAAPPRPPPAAGRRGGVAGRRGLPSLAEQGTVVVRAATHVPPAFAVLLGGDGAVLGVARLTDSVDRNALLTTWMSQVTAALNSPGVAALSGVAVTPFVAPGIGTISSASDKVSSE